MIKESPLKIWRKIRGVYVEYYDHYPAMVSYNEEMPEEYIRKYSLVEIINKIEQQVKISTEYDMGFEDGKREALKQILGKINNT